MARPIDLALHIQKLVEEKQEHTEALSRINQTLEGIGALLGQNGHRRGRKPGRPPSVASAMTDVAATPKRGRKRSLRRFGVSGEQSILDFLKQNRNATTQEVKALWKSEGRGGTADNALSKLYRDGKVKRKPLVDRRGSSFSVA